MKKKHSPEYSISYEWQELTVGISSESVYERKHNYTH